VGPRSETVVRETAKELGYLLTTLVLEALSEEELREILTELTAAVKASREERGDDAGSEPRVAAIDDEGWDGQTAEEQGARRSGRYGSTFGTAVHLAIGAALRDETVPVEIHVERAALEVGLREHLKEARDDVARGLEVTRPLIEAADGHATVRLEYPVCGEGPDGTMVLGSIDFLLLSDDALPVVDFKTDQPPAGGNVPAAHAEQVRTYADLLRAAGVGDGRKVRLSLAFTGDGTLRSVGDR
jgi:hypothetical protein